ncbi:MAG: hypothetical protein ACKO7Q_09005 [Actinomycetota bacterium]
MFWRKQGDDAAKALRAVGKQQPFRWLRQLDDAELERLAENVRGDLGACASRDDLLEAAARLHYQTRPRIEGRLARGEDVVAEEAARGRALALIFERRYGVSLERALDEGLPVEPASEEAHLRVERVLRQLGLPYTVLDEGHWVFELEAASVHIRHYVASGSLDVYAPVRAWEDGDEGAEPLLRQNGGSVAGAFWGVCTFETAGDHLCACARLATAGLVPPAVSFALASVAQLVDAAQSADADD